jgi:hypothetical protein
LKHELTLLYSFLAMQDWLCPAYNSMLHDRLVANLGSLTPQNTISDVVALTTTGNLHIAIYDLAVGDVFFSFARKSAFDDVEGEALYAYQRAFSQIDVDALFRFEKIE